MFSLLLAFALSQEVVIDFEQDLSEELNEHEVSFIDTLDKNLLDSEDLGSVESDKKHSFKGVCDE